MSICHQILICECVSVEWSYQLERKHINRRHPRGIWNMICIKHICRLENGKDEKTFASLRKRVYAQTISNWHAPSSALLFLCFTCLHHFFPLEAFSLFSFFQSCFPWHVFQKVFSKQPCWKWPPHLLNYNSFLIGI